MRSPQENAKEISSKASGLYQNKMCGKADRQYGRAESKSNRVAGSGGRDDRSGTLHALRKRTQHGVWGAEAAHAAPGTCDSLSLSGGEPVWVTPLLGVSFFGVTGRRRSYCTDGSGSASGYHYQAHSGLSPPSYHPCRAHSRKNPYPNG